MASIRREASVSAPAAKAWAMLRDVANPQRAFAGVLASAMLDGDVRDVRFENGLEVRERIIDVDDSAMRIAYTALGDLFEHHSASMTIIAGGKDRCSFVWISDFLPHAMAETITPLIEAGTAAFVRNASGRKG